MRLGLSFANVKNSLSYTNKWIPIAVLIGIVSGFGSIVFYYSIQFFNDLMLTGIGGYTPPQPLSEGPTSYQLSPLPLLIPIITMAGGLICGIIVQRFAPEAEGHGTDAAIESFHQKEGDINVRVPFVKLIASALLIGSGGSGGREGPTAQISAGFGSFLGKTLKLDAMDRRICVATGIGAGIGAIFKAPFGGAVLAAEILYISDFEASVILPSLIASTVGYSIFASVTDWSPLFGIQEQLFDHTVLGLSSYALLGLICGLLAIVYVKSFITTRRLFMSTRWPLYVRAAVGGLAVGLVGMVMPQVLGIGYGWIQILLDEDFTVLGLGLILLLIPGKIIATSLSIGSGGSGGVYAPGLFIGAMAGAAMYLVISPYVDLGVGAAPFIVVGMMALFGAAGKVPVAVILMVGEMTGSYTLMVPAIIATSLAYVISGNHTIYVSQVKTELDSPAHRTEFLTTVLKNIRVKRAMKEDFIAVRQDITVQEAGNILLQRKALGLPVFDHRMHFIGIVTGADLVNVPKEKRSVMKIEEIMGRDILWTDQDDDLKTALDRMSKNHVRALPVFDSSEKDLMIGIITRTDIVRIYDEQIDELLMD